tara:strand:+ start:133 stop:339 length:207 start_codon:yes stop_codon:yes gene_type:complete
MNDLLNDIEKLQKVTDKISNNISWDLNVASCLYELRDLIKQKQKIVDNFEQKAPNHIQDLCNQIRGAR